MRVECSIMSSRNESATAPFHVDGPGLMSLASESWAAAGGSCAQVGDAVHSSMATHAVAAAVGVCNLAMSSEDARCQFIVRYQYQSTRLGRSTLSDSRIL